jgi:formate dehydrogenase gamma subunit
MECHGTEDITKTNAAGEVIKLFVDLEKFRGSIHGTNSCAQCHSDLKETHPDDEIAALPVNCATCHDPQSHSYGASVHGHALAAGRAGVPSCKDCHGQHEVLSPKNPSSMLHWSRLANTCGECHPDVAQEVADSVHGVAMAAGSRDAPTCTDCHAEHNTRDLKAMHPVKMAEQTCGQCHASERINSRYRLPGNRMNSFMESYHGLAAQFGSTKAANCASCHGVHGIFKSTDARSMVHPANLVNTCGQCHPGATENFALSKVHTGDVNKADMGSFLNFWVRRVYLVLIFGTVGALGLHNLLAWVRKVQAMRRAPGRTVVRMNKGQRVQHLLLMSSFIILAISGFALRYPETWVSWLMGGEEVRRWIHRIAGVVLIGAGFYHIYYVMFRAEGRRLFRDMLPIWKDAKDVGTNVKYLTTGRGEKPKFGRFGYPEKFEYWAVVWGTIIMGVTGVLIWFAVDATRLMPRWVIDVATTIHFYEAILACLAIIVWHFYHVMFEPGVYPMNWAWLDGKVSEHWMKEEHPLETAEGMTDRSGNGASRKQGLMEVPARDDGQIVLSGLVATAGRRNETEGKESPNGSVNEGVTGKDGSDPS